MAYWEIHREIDLARDSRGVERLAVPAGTQANEAHKLCMRVLSGGKPADLSGCTARLTAILPDRSSVYAESGALEGGELCCVLPRVCYGQAGEVRGVLHMRRGAASVPLYGFVLLVGEDMTDTVIDPGHVIPSLAELLAEIETLRKTNKEAGDAEAARRTAESARVAAEQARASAEAARQKASADAVKAAQTAAAGANAWANATGEATTLPAGSAATVRITEESGHKVVHIGVPKGDTGATGPAGPQGPAGKNGEGTLSSATPKPLGTAAPGASTETSRADHVHPMPTAAQVGALAAGGTAAAASKLAAQRTIFGQPFDGSGNVAGNCTATCHIATDASGLLIAPANKKTFSIRNDGENTYFFIGDKAGSAEWNSARPLVISMSTGVATVSGHATSDVPTNRTVNGKALTANISVDQLKNDAGVSLLAVAGSDTATRSYLRHTVIDSAGNFTQDWGYEKSTDRGYIYVPGKTLQYLYSTTHKPTLTELGAQASLGFTPVQQSGGKEQLGNKVYIGWSGSALKAQVDATDLGAFVFASRTINGKALSANVTLAAADVKARPDTWMPTAAQVGAAAPNTDVHFNTIYAEAYNGLYIGPSSVRRVFFRNDGNTCYVMIAKSTTDLSWSSPFPLEINVSTGYTLVNGHANDDAYKAALVYQNAAPNAVQGPQTLALAAHSNTAKLYAIVAKSRTDNTSQGIVLATPGAWTTAVVRDNANDSKTIYFRNVLVNPTLTGLQIEHGRVSGDGGNTNAESDVTCIIEQVYALY